MIINDDCLAALRTLPSASVDMVYLDPPFFSQKRHTLSDRQGKTYEFSDVWESRKDYLLFLKVRLQEMKRVLKATGTLFLHCDSSASHYLRVVLDEVFGEENFRSEIIWTYKRWFNAKRGLLDAHQTIFFYSKGSGFKFNTFYGDYSPATNVDQILQQRERDDDGKVRYKRDVSGRVVGSGEKKGVPLSDVWDIPFLNPKAKERTGYPTQKPMLLLERIIDISTDEDDTVLDPFCGSGTTLAAAKLKGRKFIGIDVNPEATALTERRLADIVRTESRLLKEGATAYLTKTEKELAVLKQLDCQVVQRNKGIDAILTKQYQGAPVAVKLQKETETAAEAAVLLQAAGKKKNCRMTVLILRKAAETSLKFPDDMLVLTSYEADIEERLKH